MKKIGLFGGTFNPIHIGHLRMALEVYEMCALDQVQFVPASLPPHKSAKGILPLAMRVEMMELSFKEYQLNSVFTISLHETRLKGASYTYFSLKLWQEEHKLVPYFILGLEDFVRLNTWHNWQQLPLLAHFLVVKRAHYELEDFHKTVKSYWSEAKQVDSHSYSIFGNTISYIESSRLDISSTTVRNAYLNNKDPRLLLPQSVYGYIQQNNEILRIWGE